MTDPAGLIRLRSRHDVPETLRRFRSAIDDAGLIIFAEVDHGQNAIDVDMALRPTRLVLFGHPRSGTLLMQLGQSAGIDLPLKALVWDDADGATWFAYNDAAWIAERHHLGEGARAPVGAIAASVAKLAEAATA